MSAASQVFDTVELLETILYALPTKDLLFAQKISKQWKAVIDNSTKLQRALFFTSIPGDPVRKCMNVLKNSLVHELFEAIDTFFADEISSMQSAVLNEPEARCFNRLSWERPEASWRRMLLSQPPVQTSIYVTALMKDGHDEFTLSSEHGLKISTTFSEMDKMIRRVGTPSDLVYLGTNSSLYTKKCLEISSDLEGVIDHLKKTPKRVPYVDSTGRDAETSDKGDDVHFDASFYVNCEHSILVDDDLGEAKVNRS